MPIWLSAGCGSDHLRSFSDYSGYCIIPASEYDEADAQWAAYLTKQMERRADKRVPVVIHPSEAPSGSLTVTVDVDRSATRDYAVRCSDDGLRLVARNKEKMLWLLYQFISVAGSSDARLSVADLPPAILSCQQDTAADFAFEYRGLYTPTNADPDEMGIFASHHVDYDWGLWGHNLHKIFPSEVPADARALVDGARSEDQYCFSSESLYKAVETFVIDNYGYGTADENARFCIMPNDNSEVCQCAACKKAGNTPSSATPAVTAFVERLARRFPHHSFFTSAYTTTRRPPSHKLPSNVGVLMSALDVPLAAEFASVPEGRRFDADLEAWSAVTSCIYVWDYMRNFDDYLTPYPCLNVLRSRLRHYREKGVRGVFFNGSGDDYASFDELQTGALAAMLVSPDMSVADYTNEYWRRAYPQTAGLLRKFYDEIEKKAFSATDGKALQPYSGIGDAAGLYLSASAFDEFWHSLDRAAKNTDTEERTRLNKLLTALSFTRLELMRLRSQAPDPAEADDCIACLEGHSAFPEMKNYREANGLLADYLREWRDDSPWLDTAGDCLSGVTLKILSGSDKSNPGSVILTDGVRGFISDYHTGWLVAPDSILELEIPAGLTPTASELRVGMLHAPEWRIYLPVSIEAWQGATCIGKQTVTSAPTGAAHVRREISLPLHGFKGDIPVRLRLVRTEGARRTLAVDEVAMY